MAVTKLRPLGKILLDLEPLILEMTHDHDLQHGDVLSLIHVYLMIHSPGAREVYKEDGTSPMFFYGPQKDRE